MNRTAKRILAAAQDSPLYRVPLTTDLEKRAAHYLHMEGLGIYDRDSKPPEFAVSPPPSKQEQLWELENRAKRALEAIFLAMEQGYPFGVYEMLLEASIDAARKILSRKPRRQGKG